MERKRALNQIDRVREHTTTGDPKPPTDVAHRFTPSHLAIWDQYLTCRAPADWDRGDLRLLAQAVMLETSILTAFQEIASEGATLLGANGRKTLNPSVSALQKFMQSQGAILRRLGISVSGTVAPRDVRKNAEQARKLRQSQDGTEADDLLAH